ncbi:MAG: VOC family protein [Pseudomonadota bacterium]
MAHGDVIWADLSTFDIPTAKAFYGRALGWTFSEAGGYHVARSASGDVAGLYEMPQKFLAIRMPSFWMSYFEVESADAAAETATRLGGKVEVGPEDQAGLGRFALIRDPLGAGFTVLERPEFSGAEGRSHALIVSDADAILPFYQALFGWSFASVAQDVWSINLGDKPVAELHEIPDPAVRGKEEYWAIAFGADARALDAAGAERLGDIDLIAGPAGLWRDDQGASFLAREALIQAAPSSTSQPLLAWAGLGLIAISVLTGWAWIWAVFLAAWVIAGLRDRATYLLQTVTRADHPILYWTLLSSYSLLAVFALWGANVMPRFLDSHPRDTFRKVLP